MIRMQDPLKQGLKLKLVNKHRDIINIRMQDPLKQGLKLRFSDSAIIMIIIRMQDPLKQGLKLPPSHILCPYPSTLFECKIH